MPMISSLRSWFARPGARGSRPEEHFARLKLERLETRECPATTTLPVIASVRRPVNTGHMGGVANDGNQAETAIAIDPTNPNRLFVASNNAFNGGQGLYASRSVDGGLTWTARRIAAGNDNLPPGFTDPSLAWDTFGNLFFTYINNAADTCIVALSINGGLTFNQIAAIPVSDQPTVTVGAGTVWVQYIDPNGEVAASGARVTGLNRVGQFSAPQIVPNNPVSGNFGDVAIGPNGQVTVVFQDSGAPANGPSGVYVSTDPDGLGPAGFTTPQLVFVSNVGPTFGIPAQPGPFNVGGRTIDAETGLAYDRSNGPFRGRLYMVYTDRATLASTDFDTNIFLRYSTDNGKTWSSPLRLNDDDAPLPANFLAFGQSVPAVPIATTRSQFMSKIAIDQTTGDVAVAWLDCRRDPGFGPYDRDGIPNTDVLTFATLVTNGGQTIYRNLQVANGASNSVTLNPNGVPNGNPPPFNFGDYMGLTFDRGYIYPVWADNSVTLPAFPQPTFDIATARIRVVRPPTLRLFYPLRLIYDPATQTYRGNLTLTNVGDIVAFGTGQFIFTGLPPGVTVANATGSRNGFPTLNVGFSTLSKNQVLRIPIVLRNPFRVPLSTIFNYFRTTLVLQDTVVLNF